MTISISDQVPNIFERHSIAANSTAEVDLGAPRVVGPSLPGVHMRVAFRNYGPGVIHLAMPGDPDPSFDPPAGLLLPAGVQLVVQQGYGLERDFPLDDIPEPPTTIVRLLADASGAYFTVAPAV